MAAKAQTGSLIEAIDLYGQGEYQAAEARLQTLLKNDPQNATGKTFLALTHAATGRCPEAAADLQAVFESKTDNETDRNVLRLAGLGLARCQIAAEQFERAFSVLYRLKQLHPEDADVLYETARAQMKAWNGIVQEMFEKTPASFRVNQLSAEIFEIQGRHSEAVGEYRKAIEKAPRALNLHYRLARALLMESHEPAALEAARKEFEAELALNPNDAVAHYQIAQILEAQQKTAEALPRLERAVELDPDFPEALIALGRARLAANRNGEAVTLLEKATRLTPESESAHYALLLAYRNAGRREDAQRQSQRLNELQKSPEGEFTEFLKRIGEQPSQPQTAK
ncbi:MAG: tetratricopeptide repeat protein [Bryobacterales bacterium]